MGGLPFSKEKGGGVNGGGVEEGGRERGRETVIEQGKLIN